MSFGYSPQHADHHRPIGYCSQQLFCGTGTPPFLRAIIATTLLVRVTKKIIVGSPLTIVVPHAAEALLNSHLTQHFSVSHLALC